ncbi:N-acetylmuramoyl-L-alanine amidase [Halovulum dunhuangense]|uniref:N-acetylmuramoyl-L-alanine amidase n=1 Tax=Halovulum dunhuangense TaxID=1505036 RepID=A0A849L2Y5_9RHOB|nr:N-acetylmuramoyl-L-alanine amidase [Halovulum dunhuangense]NNU80659.1 N-acetylmuramoyl-L-alanine amidase [Halovulum dunhuangense]
MHGMTRRQAGALILGLLGGTATARAEVVLTAVQETRFSGLVLRLDLDAPLPFRAFVLADPPRLVVDVADPELRIAGRLAPAGPGPLRAGRIDARWSRLIAPLERPMTVAEAGIDPGGALRIALERASGAELAAAARLAPGPEVLGRIAPPPPAASSLPRIVIDPGHGGIDPGALRGEIAEKDIALATGLELAAQLERTGRYEVALTRRDDRFVLLDDRVRFARASDAALFLSLHTNTVTAGQASGATLYVSSSEASDSESARRARLENGSDSAAGLRPSEVLDDVARTLMDLESRANGTRSRMAAERLVESLSDATGVIRSRPLRAADFQVLRAPEMPSALIELGFLSDAGDRADMVSPAWQRRFSAAIVTGIDEWMTADRAFLALMQR